MLVQYWCDFATWSLEIIETRYASVPARTTRFNQRNPLKLSYRCSLFFVKSYSISDHSLHSVVKRDTSDMIVQRLGKRRSKYRCIRTIFPNQKKIPFNLISLLFLLFFFFYLFIFIYLLLLGGNFTIIGHWCHVVRPTNTDTHTFVNSGGSKCANSLIKILHKKFLSSLAIIAWFRERKKLND